MTVDRKQLEQAILRTIAYFDVFEYPLRAAEVWRWLYRGQGEQWTTSQAEVEVALKVLVEAQQLEHHADFYGLPNRIRFVAQRTEREAGSERKWRRAKTVAQFVELFPFVKFAGVANTLAINNARPESDIDLLIIGSPNQLWSARMMVTGIVQMLGYRRHGEDIADRICLSFYLTPKTLDLRPLALQDDHHFRFWATQVVPLMDDGVWASFQSANRDFTERLPHAWTNDQVVNLKPRKAMRGVKHFFESSFGGARGGMIETLARDYQRQRMDKNIHSKANEGTTDVVISDDVLKFHEDDRRARYNKAYVDRCRLLGIAP